MQRTVYHFLAESSAYISSRLSSLSIWRSLLLCPISRSLLQCRRTPYTSQETIRRAISLRSPLQVGSFSRPTALYSPCIAERRGDYRVGGCTQNSVHYGSRAAKSLAVIIRSNLSFATLPKSMMETDSTSLSVGNLRHKFLIRI